ncbi:TolC family protein, partial [Desulfovibrio sp. OttesenSCG-928-M14]|nr:TolC family protein [Desulfovibrio sp. OttesenSCG-928-M14]
MQRTWFNRELFVLLLLVSVMLISACQPKRQIERLGPPWNQARMRENVKPHTDAGNYEAPILPAEDQALTFEDCIITAAQNAPDLINSVIELELAEIAEDDAFWRRLPSVRAMFRITTNLTKHHKEYSDTIYRLSMGVYDFEPVVSLFQSRAAAKMKDIALLTHQIAVENRARQIGESMLRLDCLAKIHALQAAKYALAQQAIDYYRTKQGEVSDKLELAEAEHDRIEAEVAMHKTENAMASVRLQLKVMLGLDLDRQIRVQPGSLEDMMQKDDLSNIFADRSWEQIWKTTQRARI